MTTKESRDLEDEKLKSLKEKLEMLKKEKKGLDEDDKFHKEMLLWIKFYKSQIEDLTERVKKLEKAIEK